MAQHRRIILLAEISELMETIKEQFDALRSYEDEVPVLEFDILKDNIRRLYEKLGQLQKENDQPDIFVKQNEEVMKEPGAPSKSESGTAEVRQSSIEIPPQNIPEKRKSAEPKEETTKLDLFSSETSEFNEKLKKAREESLGPRSPQTTAGDIKSLININDKFLFINDLFDGDYKEYSKTIEIFNNFDEKGEAFDFLNMLMKDNLWNSASPAFQKLKEIVEKRFS